MILPGLALSLYQWFPYFRWTTQGSFPPQGICVVLTFLFLFLTLLQVSTLSSWGVMAYESWFGCGMYSSSPYVTAGSSGIGLESRLSTHGMGNYQGFICDKSFGKPVATFCFFTIYIVITAWIIMSLFIGVRVQFSVVIQFLFAQPK